MPKIRTRRTVAKRFKVTASGKVRRSRATMTHGMGKRSQRSIRRNRHECAVPEVEQRSVKRLLGQ